MPTDDVLIIGQLKDKELRDSIKDLVDFVDKQSGTMADHFENSLGKMQEAMKKFAVNQKASVSLMKEAMQQYGLMFDDIWKQTFPDQQKQQTHQPKQYAPDTIGALEQELAKKKEIRKEDELDSDALKQHNREIEETINKLSKQKGLNTIAAQVKEARKDISAALSMPTNSLEQAEKKLKVLNATMSSWRGKGILDSSQWNRLENAVDRTRMKIEKLSAQSPTMKSIKTMSEKSVADIAKKLQAIRNVQVDPKNITQVRKLGDEYQRLTRLQNQLLGKGIQLTKSNNYLAQSFGYIRNRLVYAMTLGAATSFVKNVYEVRSQYELLERSLGVLLGSFERGTQIFNELNTMALKSPFTLMELGTAAKQLTAYNFKAEEVVNTTKRLADLSAALGVPMERLTYNLGQIRAQTVLTARDARDFANAGLPIVKSLSEYFTELEGRVVSTGDVFERMSKKQVTYNDVMAVLNEMTDEGGKFFDFQAKQAETLRVQLANLTLAWNNMLNDIGEANQGLLTAPINALKALFANWKEISHVITEVVLALGAYKGMQIIVNKLIGESATMMQKSILVDKEKKAAELEREATTRKLTKTEQKSILNKKEIVAADYKAILSTRNLSKTQALLLAAYNKKNKELIKALVQMKLVKAAEVQQITVGKAWKIVLEQIKISLISLGATIKMFISQAAVMLAIGAIVEAVYTWGEIADKIKDINKGITDSAKESADSISSFLDKYKETIRKANELKTYMAPNGVPTVVDPNTGKWSYKNSMGEEETQKAWEAIKEEIKQSSAASDVFLRKLMSINDMNERIRQGFALLEQIHDVNGALESLDDTAIEVTGDWSKWWNLWQGSDGLIDNLKDYTDYLTMMEEKWGNIDNLIEASKNNVDGAGGELHDVNAKLSTFMNDLRVTTESMYKAFLNVGLETPEEMREAFDRTNQKILEDANLSAKEQLHYKIQSEKDFIDYKTGLFNEEYEFEKSRGNEERAQRVLDEMRAWKQAFGQGQAISQEFFSWLRNQHASEINKLFGNMSKREIEQIDWSEPKWKKWAQDNAESFASQYGIAFDRLKFLVDDANRWKIFLKLFITTDEKGVYDTLKDADAAANAAWTKIERLKKRQEELNAKKVLNDSERVELQNLAKELEDAQKDYDEAIAKGGHASKEEKKNTKDQKTAEQQLAEALKQELQVIKDMQSNYEKLTKAGVDSMTALDAATQGYEATLRRVNSVLSKYGISKFNAKDFVGNDVNDLLAKLEKQRNQLLASGKAKTSAVEALDLKIKEVRVEATTYNMKKVTDGLTNELNKTKEEYEIGLELDANPELGNIFGDMLGIDKGMLDSLPRDFDQVVTRLQGGIDSLFRDNHINKAFDLKSMLNKGDFDEWVAKQGNTLDDGFAKALNAIREYANKVRLDEAKDTTKQWSELVEKYGSLQGKIVKIAKDTANQQLGIIKKFGNDKQVKDAMDLAKRITISQDPDTVAELQSQLRDLMAKVVANNEQAMNISTSVNNEHESLVGKAYWEDFKDSNLYAMTFEDMSRVSTKAIETIIGKLEELKSKVKEDPASMKALTNSLKEARGELESRSASVTILSSLKEINEASVNLTTSKKALADADKELVNAQREYDESEDSEDITLIESKMNKLIEAREKYKKAIEDNVEAENDYKKSTAKLKAGLELMSKELQNIQGLFDTVAKLFSAAGDDETADAINAISEGFSVMTTVIMGVVAAMVLLETTQPWLLAIAAVLSTIIGLVSWLSGSDNDKIDKKIKQSELAVKKLELAYIDLKRAVDKAYGTSVIGAKTAAAAAKKLELQELERQLRLERSRDSKHKDESRIVELQKQIKELRYEIQDMYTDVVNDLMGTDVGSFAENLVSAMVDAFKQGEDAMKVFNDKFDELIDNMIMKSLVSRVVSSYIDKLWEEQEQKIKARSQEESNKLVEAKNEYDKVKNMSEMEWLRYHYGTDKTMSLLARAMEESGLNGKELAEYLKNLYEHRLDAIETMVNNAQNAFNDATIWTNQDINEVVAGIENIKGGLYDNLYNAISQWYTFGEDSDKNLSKLQQGIQGITEDTAGAIEAYMNILSQRVFTQSEYIAEIRDAVVTDRSVAELDALRQVKESILGMDSDAQLGTMSLMLLQLQQCYQVQQAIRARLDGWSNSTGMAVRVEMV